jgi:TolB-like protein/Tfp pilus assembly protein PilF
MASIAPGYEYDIFISYRQKDNRGDHWVSEFVKALKAELDTTIKDDISIYFDENPADGLLENHDVDKSLEGKLKCLIFIPILSQTYCDPKSFAWNDEFCAFNRLAKVDSFGRDIKLSNGNVASRILAIKIHDLDATDKQTIENEIGGVLRAIEFIYKEPGVNRPLKPSDNKNDSQHKTDYRNQVNKVANAIKDLLIAMRANEGAKALVSKDSIPVMPLKSRKWLAIAATVLIVASLIGFVLWNFGGMGGRMAEIPDRSIAVLPFDNMNNDPEQDYFSNGITEDILNHLVKISDLKVKSRTSTLQYKGTTKTAPVIGGELGVSNIVEGSVRRVGDKVRVVVQLIDTETDLHLWSETYDRDLKDVLALQSEIAIEIAQALKARLTDSEKENIQQQVSRNVTAYDYFLKAREIMNQTGLTKSDFDNALALINQSIRLDPDFAKGIAFKGTIMIESIYYLGLNDKMIVDSVRYLATKAIEVDASEPSGYLLRAVLERFVGNDDTARLDYEKAYELSPNDAEVAFGYGSQLIDDSEERGADLILKSIESQYRIQDARYYSSMSDFYYFSDDYESTEKLLQEAKKLDPGNSAVSVALGRMYLMRKDYDKAIQEMKRTSADVSWVADNLGHAYYQKGDYAEAAKYWSKYKEIEAGFVDKTQTVPFRHRLGMAYAKMGQQKKADSLYAEQLKISLGTISGSRAVGTWGRKALAYYDVAVCYGFMGNEKAAVQYLDSAKQLKFAPYTLVKGEQAFEHLKGREDYKAVFTEVEKDFNFKRKAFSNALNRAKASKELKGLKDL